MISRHMKIAIVLLALIAVFLAGYNRALKKHAERLQDRMVDLRPIAPPVNAPTLPVTVWVAHDEDGSLHSQTVKAALPDEPTQRARQILRALFSAYLNRHSPHPIGDGSDVSDVYLLGTDTFVINLNTAFADTHRSGILVEELTMMSIVRTVATNFPAIRRVKFLVDGKERETLAGHADLEQFYDVNLVAQSARALQ
ncbi:MAG TPA: GerMN domain-containing protein [Terriglobales bacterium]|nr:GerMN domain-containing protein [Terriglobales bacterium]